MSSVSLEHFPVWKHVPFVWDLDIFILSIEENDIEIAAFSKMMIYSFAMYVLMFSFLSVFMCTHCVCAYA